MNIVVTSPYFYPHQGGSERYIEELYSRVVKQVKSVTVVAYDTEKVGWKDTYKGMNIIRLPAIEILKDQFALTNYFKLSRLQKVFAEADTINAHTRFFDSSWWTPLLSKSNSVVKIFTDHTATHPVHPSGFVRGVAKVVDSTSLRWINKHYSHFTAVSYATRDFMAAHGISHPIKVFYGGVDVKYFNQISKQLSRSELRYKLGLLPEQKVVSFVGRLIPAKGVKETIIAMEKLLTSYPTLTVLIAGSGPLSSWIEARSGSRIRYLGKLEKKQVAELMLATDILVHPSSHHEGLPLTILEAGAAGCVVVATDNGATKEVIVDRKTGYIVEPDSIAIEKKVRKILNYWDIASKVGNELAKLIRNRHDWDVISSRYIDWIMYKSDLKRAE